MESNTTTAVPPKKRRRIQESDNEEEDPEQPGSTTTTSTTAKTNYASVASSSSSSSSSSAVSIVPGPTPPPPKPVPAQTPTATIRQYVQVTPFLAYITTANKPKNDTTTRYTEFGAAPGWWTNDTFNAAHRFYVQAIIRPESEEQRCQCVEMPPNVRVWFTRDPGPRAARMSAMYDIRLPSDSSPYQQYRYFQSHYLGESMDLGFLWPLCFPQSQTILIGEEGGPIQFGCTKVCELRLMPTDFVLPPNARTAMPTASSNSDAGFSAESAFGLNLLSVHRDSWLIVAQEMVDYIQTKLAKDAEKRRALFQTTQDALKQQDKQKGLVVGMCPWIEKKSTDLTRFIISCPFPEWIQMIATACRSPSLSSSSGGASSSSSSGVDRKKKEATLSVTTAAAVTAAGTATAPVAAAESASKESVKSQKIQDDDDDEEEEEDSFSADEEEEKKKQPTEEEVQEWVESLDIDMCQRAMEWMSKRIQKHNLAKNQSKFLLHQRVRIKCRSGSFVYGTVTNFYAGRHSGSVQVLIDGRKRAQPVRSDHVLPL
jgi:hypothetical protein